MSETSWTPANLKPGDRVWVGREYSDGSGKYIKSVERVTSTQVLIRWNSDANYVKRYKRDSGYEIGGGILSGRIMRLATSDECAAWDAKERTDREVAVRKAAEQEATERTRRSLADLFGDNAYVSKEQWGERSQRVGKWSVEFHFLTEEQVRGLAELHARGEA